MTPKMIPADGLVPLHTLKAGDKFRLPGKGFTATVDYQSPRMAEIPEGQLMVEKML